MQKRHNLGFKLSGTYRDKLDSLVTRTGMKTETAVARHLLTRAVEGSLIPTLGRTKKETPQVSVVVTEEFKAMVDTLRGATPVSELMESLLDAYEEEQNQGEAK